MTAHSLKALLDQKAEIELIDIRENYERAISSIGGRHIPLADLYEMLGTIPTDKQVVIYCNSGKRGEAATHSLHCKGLVNVSNLDGGLIEWRNSIDPSLPSD